MGDGCRKSHHECNTTIAGSIAGRASRGSDRNQRLRERGPAGTALTAARSGARGAVVAAAEAGGGRRVPVPGG